MSSSGTDGSDDDEYDNILDSNDTTGLSSLFDSASLNEIPDISTITVPMNHSSYVIRSAFGNSFHLPSSELVSPSAFDDSIRSYIDAPPLFQSTPNVSSYYLSIDPTANQSNSNPDASDKLHVKNVIYTATSHQLKEFFDNLGFHVVHIDLPNGQSGRNSGVAFVRFQSKEIAGNALYQFGRTPSTFRFCGRILKLNRCRKPRQRPKAPVPDHSIGEKADGIVYFDIANVHYGTFIMGAAMSNIIGANRTDDFGLIAHCLVNDERDRRTRLKIDQELRKLSITVSYESRSMFGVSHDLSFEWTFGALKGEKVSPVLVNNSVVGLLVEVKRPPIILHTSSSSLADGNYDKRMPGTPLIGRANAWLFQLNGGKAGAKYMELFRILRRYNLSPRRFFEHHILHLIHPLHTAQENLRHVQLLSNDKWVQDNRQRVNHFLHHRWPQYPFGTKYEIMKLLSKHIVTINDLIIDEQLDEILARCSLNTFIACTDKIVEFAPRWLHDTCDHEDEDWGEEEQSQPTEDEQAVNNNIETVHDNSDDSPHFVLSALGQYIDATNTEQVLVTDHILRDNPAVQMHQCGCLSVFLKLALRQLQSKHELRRTTIDGIYVTKHEVNTVNDNSSLIRKVYITPSTILYEGPYREEKCLVTRHYEQQQDGFLRVTFRDEDYRKLQYNNADMSKLYERIKEILINGIGVCDRQYDFLAFSSSQLREHCCWMFSAMDNVSANSIRQWMGDFRKSRPVAKMAARLGQSFSTTKKGLELSSRQWREISDVKSGSVCYTDGIGIIAPWLARNLCKELKIDDSVYCPCAFQIRFGGYKGMVCIDTARRITDPTIGLYLRNSMNKFDSKNLSIGIVHVSSKPSVGSLNRQIILLLSSLGIRDHIFLSMQRKMLDDLKILTTNHRKADQSLKRLGESGGNGYHIFLLKYLKRFAGKIDPFAQRLLTTFQAYFVKELRIKARILVPGTWSLFGVVDETRTLKYGEVFIQIEQRNESGDNESGVLTGSVVVTRNPCFHPGDIRRLTAIDVPALRELKNVIVFPMQGNQSHPAEMSGGDLDGDTFWVSHKKEFLFPNNEQPFDYHDQAVTDAARISSDDNTVYSIKDVCAFFVEYIEADNLGVIAHSHLAFADRSPLRAKAEQCLRLARMHSTAVDFAKSGVSAQRLTPDLRPPAYPHFMEKQFKSSYHSETILGQLYDEVKKFENDLTKNRAEDTMNPLPFPYDSLIVDGSDAFMVDASITKNEYELELKRVMRQYGIANEAELVSGYILKFTTKQYAKQGKTFELRNEISHAVKMIQEKYLRIFYEELYHHAHDEDRLLEDIQWSEASKSLTWKTQLDFFEFRLKIAETTNDSELAKKASAWFRVTYKWFLNQTKKSEKNNKPNRERKNRTSNNEHQNRQSKSQPLLSFAWIVYPVLMTIYDNKQKLNET